MFTMEKRGWGKVISAQTPFAGGFLLEQAAGCHNMCAHGAARHLL